MRYFSSIVKETNEYLDKHANNQNICKNIIDEIKSKYSFEIECHKHGEALLQYFQIVTIKLTVFNWCSIINKILKGIDNVRLKDPLPHMQNKAIQKYKKKLKYKKLNK